MASEKKLTVVIGGDASGATKAFSEAEGGGSKLGGTLLKLGAAVGGVFAVKEGIDVLKDSMKEAAAEQQNMAVLNHTLDENLHTTEAQKEANEKWITSLQNATGVSRDELEPALGKLVIAGEDLTTAHKNMAIATDIAAARHIDLATVIAGIAKAAATGHTTALGRLGLATKDAAGHTLTLDQVLQNASKTMGGSAAAAADTAAGRAKILSEKFTDLKVQIGSYLIPVMSVLTTALSGVVGWLGDKLPGAIDKVKTFLSPLVADFKLAVEIFQAAFSGVKFADDTGWIGAVEKLATATKTTADWIQQTLLPALVGFAQWVIGNQPVLIGFLSALGVGFTVWAVTAAAAALETALAMAPVILLAVAIGALVAGVIWAYQNWGWFHDAIDKVATFMRDTLWPIMQNVAGWIAHSLIPTIQSIVVVFFQIVDDISGLWSGLWDGIGAAITWTWEHVIEPVIDTMKRALDDVTGPLKAVAGFGGRVANDLNPFRAAGGPVAAGGGYIVGENGPEWFSPGSSGTIIPNHALGGGGNSYSIMVNVAPGGDLGEAGRQMVDAIRVYEQRNGSGWRG